jgi:tungstate transport system substrate-binding protein
MSDFFSAKAWIKSTGLQSLVAVLLTWGAVPGSEILKLATTTSTYETGLLEVVLPGFEKRTGVKVHVISVGTGKALKLAQNGDVDLVLVHAPSAEKAFVKAGYGVNRRHVMTNDFVILGPKTDPAGIKNMSGAAQALKKIAESQAEFVSRGDESGTHKKEKNLWRAAAMHPEGKWYLECGQGMTAALKITDEKNAYVLVDRASWLFNRKALRMELLVEGDSILFNPYSVIAVSPYRHPHVNYLQAMGLIAWLTGPECQKLIHGYKREGQRLFLADAAEYRE